MKKEVLICPKCKASFECDVDLITEKYIQCPVCSEFFENKLIKEEK